VIGMPGRTSWESTAEYYRLSNEAVRDRLSGLYSARIVLASLDPDLVLQGIDARQPVLP
jgi:aspartate racemase